MLDWITAVSAGPWQRPRSMFLADLPKLKTQRPVRQHIFTAFQAACTFAIGAHGTFSTARSIRHVAAVICNLFDTNGIQSHYYHCNTTLCQFLNTPLRIHCFQHIWNLHSIYSLLPAANRTLQQQYLVVWTYSTCSFFTHHATRSIHHRRKHRPCPYNSMICLHLDGNLASSFRKCIGHS